MKKNQITSVAIIILIILTTIVLSACVCEEHRWSSATCQRPETCAVCRETRGEVGTHQWSSATCQHPKTCEFCRQTEGKAADHIWSEEVWGENQKCITCGIKSDLIPQPTNEYFAGNVFQIICKDLGDIPISTGSGFVINSDGWFITNSHVMSDAYFAVAIFNIPNQSIGESFTQLSIDLGYYNNYDKDIFVGKLSNYSTIKSHYKDITFATESDIGDIVYSVGYPNSSIDLEIHEGNIISDISTLYDKLYSGISYVGFDSYTSHGSSGGILVNNHGKVLGMTTLGYYNYYDVYQYGAAISSYNILPHITNLNTAQAKPLTMFLHPDEEVFIKYFLHAVACSSDDTRPDGSQKSTKTILGDCVRYIFTWIFEGTTQDNMLYTSEQTLFVDSDGWICFTYNIYWEGGSRRETMFYGYYSHTKGLANFTFTFLYEYDDADYYAMQCDEINYSTQLALTLNKLYTTKCTYGSPNASDIEYAKKQFNWIYEWLFADIAQFA